MEVEDEGGVRALRRIRELNVGMSRIAVDGEPLVVLVPGPLGTVVGAPTSASHSPARQQLGRGRERTHSGPSICCTLWYSTTILPRGFSRSKENSCERTNEDQIEQKGVGGQRRMLTVSSPHFPTVHSRSGPGSEARRPMLLSIFVLVALREALTGQPSLPRLQTRSSAPSLDLPLAVDQHANEGARDVLQEHVAEDDAVLGARDRIELALDRGDLVSLEVDLSDLHRQAVHANSSEERFGFRVLNVPVYRSAEPTSAFASAGSRGGLSAAGEQASKGESDLQPEGVPLLVIARSELP